MAAPIFKKNRVEQTIDLEETFGVSFKGMRSLREALGEAILDTIRKRSEAGKGLRFSGERATPVTLKKPYSKAYKDSLDFKAFGKSPAKINMTLTGDMLGLMDIKKQTGESITIGWDEKDENAKAYNHSVGDTVPRRPFFGVSKTELNKIKKDFSAEIREAVNTRNSEGRKAFESRVAGLLNLIKDESDG
jgi:hypothetical protein